MTKMYEVVLYANSGRVVYTESYYSMLGLVSSDRVSWEDKMEELWRKEHPIRAFFFHPPRFKYPGIGNPVKEVEVNFEKRDET